MKDFLNPFGRRSNVTSGVLIPACMCRDSREQSHVIGGALIPACVDRDSCEQSETISQTKGVIVLIPATVERNYWTDGGNVIGTQMYRFPRSWIIIVLIPATVDRHILTPTKRATLSDRSDSKF